MKKLLQIFLVLCTSFSLFACNQTDESRENPETQAQFETYLDELFEEEVGADFLTFHYTLANPEEKGYEKPAVNWGSLTLESTKQAIEDSKEELDQLHEFEKEELTGDQQKIYRLLEIQLEYNIEYENYYMDYGFCFGENKVNDNLITNLTEYRISNKEDVEDFITLLNDVDRYISEGIEATREMADNGNIQKESEKEAILEQCRNFLESEEIEKYFHNEVMQLEELSDAERSDYENQVTEAVANNVKPAYEKIIALYEELPVADNQGSLAERENGKEYFEYLLKTQVGKERSVDEWIKIVEEEVDATIYSWINIMFSSDIDAELENIELPADNAEDLVHYLEGCLDEEFPAIDQVTYRVDYLDATVANDLVSAYYVIPPIDAPDLNVIKVNPSNTDLVDLFSTLAHEGFPGHLYQNNYAVQNDQPDIYYLLDNLGSSEGWAEYVGMDAYRIGNIGSEDFQEYMRLYSYLNRMLNEYIGLQVNYNGWQSEDIANYLDEMGLVSDIAQALYEDAVLRPAMYAPYSLGTYEVLSLREEAEDALGDNFDALSFNQALLDAGTVHFEIIEQEIDEYIENNK